MKFIPTTCRRRYGWRAFAWSLLVLLGLIAERGLAQNASELAATYGRGVHAYFAGQNELAEELFSQVIAAGSKDPRVYYFRAMTRLGCGRDYEAEEDMKVGAAFEAQDPGYRHAISKALERIQGPQRRQLESFRQQARLDRLQQRQLQTRDRYENLRSREPDVLRREAPVPLEDLIEPSLSLPGAVPTAPAPVTPTPATPVPATPPAVVPSDPAPVTPPQPAADDPFGAGSTDAEPATTEPAEPPAATPPATEPAETAEPSDDVFDASETEGDPFEQSEPAAEPEPEAPPAEESEPAEESDSDDDPFAATSGAAVKLAEGDRIESGQMAGVLGRVASSVLPWRGMGMPALTPSLSPGNTPADEPPVDVVFGPTEEPAAVAPAATEVVPASAEEPAEAEDGGDLFGEDAESTDTQPVQPETPAVEEAAAPIDDPFGETE